MSQFYLINTLTSNRRRGGCNENNKISTGIKRGAMPAHFYPSNSDNFFSLNRNSFLRTSNKLPKYQNEKRIEPTSSSSYIESKRRNAVGKSTMILPDKFSYATIDKNDSRDALRRTRNKGCSVPKKKGFYFK